MGFVVLRPVLLLCLAGATSGGKGGKKSFTERAATVLRDHEKAEKLRRSEMEKDLTRVEKEESSLVVVSKPRACFELYRKALGHMLVFFAPLVDLPEESASWEGFLARAGELEEELWQLVKLGKKEDYYWWHGPKRHIPVKFQQLLELDPSHIM